MDNKRRSLPQCPQFIAPNRVSRGLAILHAADMQRRRSAELDLGPFQVGNLRRPKPMAERHEDERGIAVTVASAAPC
jgi:hypothetical protein